jgi:hypothetical protein
MNLNFLFLIAIVLTAPLEPEEWFSPTEKLGVSSTATFTVEELNDTSPSMVYCRNACKSDHTCLGYFYSKNRRYCQGSCSGVCLYFNAGYLPYAVKNGLDGVFEFKTGNSLFHPIVEKRDGIIFSIDLPDIAYLSSDTSTTWCAADEQCDIVPVFTRNVHLLLASPWLHGSNRQRASDMAIRC